MREKQKIENVIVRCPSCGRIHAVSEDRETWKCRCKLLGETGRTQKISVQESMLEDQTSLTLEDGVTAAPGQDFQMANCNKLEEVTINGYQVIPAGAFSDCTALRTVRLSEGVELIDERAFAGCSSLKEIILPEGLKIIRAGAFQGSGLKRVILPGSVEKIGNRAFADCAGLEDASLADGLIRIGTSAFQRTGLKNITLPDSVTSIGKKAFANCHALEKAVIPAKITNIKEGTFQNSGLSDIVWKGYIKLIDSWAFASCPSLEKIVLPEGLERIGADAFRKSGLKQITWPDSLWDVHPTAFGECCQLEEISASHKASIYIPFAALPSSPFSEKYLKQHIREDGVVENHTCLLDGILAGETGTCLVYYHAQQKSENIPERFAYIPKITELRFEPGTRSIDDFMFRGCQNLKYLTLPDGLEKIGEGAFADCTALEEVIIPESVVEIAPFAFGKCSSLRTVQIAESLLEKLDSSVFARTPFAKNTPQTSARPWRDVLLVGLGTGASGIVSALGHSLDFRQDVLIVDPEQFLYYGKSAKRNPAWGKEAVEDLREEICTELQKYDFVIVAARLGGAAGSGGAPVLAQWLHELNIPHLFITSLPQPLLYESKRRILQARESVIRIKEAGTVPLVIPNDWVRWDSAFDGYMGHDFSVGDDMMYHIVQTMTELINLRELDTPDFYHTNRLLEQASPAHICYRHLYDLENIDHAVHSVAAYLSRVNAKDVTACFLVPPDTDPKAVMETGNAIGKALPAETNFVWKVVREERREESGILFITTDDNQEELSLDGDSIILNGGYPVLNDDTDEHIW